MMITARTHPHTRTKLVNMRHTRDYDIRIDRASSLWGNPFVIGVDCDTREQAIRLFEIDLLNDPRRMSRLHELAGKTLACWCVPLRCHGEVYVRLLSPGLC